MDPHENCPCMEECPLNLALRLIGGKWKMQILCSLHNNGPTRYNRLKRSLDGVSNTVLAGALRELEADGLVIRREYLEVPVRVEYEVAPRSRPLILILDDLGQWYDSLRAEREPLRAGRGDTGKPGGELLAASKNTTGGHIPADDGGAAP